MNLFCIIVDFFLSLVCRLHTFKKILSIVHKQGGTLQTKKPALLQAGFEKYYRRGASSREHNSSLVSNKLSPLCRAKMNTASRLARG